MMNSHQKEHLRGTDEERQSAQGGNTGSEGALGEKTRTMRVIAARPSI